MEIMCFGKCDDRLEVGAALFPLECVEKHERPLIAQARSHWREVDENLPRGYDKGGLKTYESCMVRETRRCTGRFRRR